MMAGKSGRKKKKKKIYGVYRILAMKSCLVCIGYPTDILLLEDGVWLRPQLFTIGIHH